MYKIDQGRTTRIVAFVIFVALAFYAAYSFMSFGEIWQWPKAIRTVGSLIWLFGFTMLGGWLAFWKPGSGEYFIELDSEMRKVVWPKVQPLFDAKTEAWGSTYVVIACTVVFTVLIFALDTVLGLGLHTLLFRGWLFKG